MLSKIMLSRAGRPAGTRVLHANACISIFGVLLQRRRIVCAVRAYTLKHDAVEHAMVAVWPPPVRRHDAEAQFQRIG